MKFPKQVLKSVTDFPEDSAYQNYWREVREASNLDDGFAYSVNLIDGQVQRGGKMALTPKKISKSDSQD